MSGGEDPALALVERALLLLERDGQVDLAAVCKDHPGLLPVVEAAFACRSVLQFGAVASAAGERDALLGVLLGERYRLLRRLGAGAMGAVYEAEDTVLGRHVAAKVLHRALFGGEGEARQRFLREARAVAALHHPGIVAVHDHGGGDPPFLIMDLVAGTDLAAILAQVVAAGGASRTAGRALRERFFAGSGAEPWDRPWTNLVAALFAGAARAVAHAHALGVVHRDLKPSNLLVRADGAVVVVDFGLARIAGEATLTLANLPLGTPSYMAPELAAGGQPTPASDVYALGASLYHALALRPPFTGDPTTVLAQVQQRAPVPLRRLAADVPRDLATICGKAMAREARDRYESAGDLASDLDAFDALRPIAARPLSLPQRALRWTRRHPERTAVVGLVALLAPALVIAHGSVVEARERRARLEANDARRHVPALLTIEGRDPAQNLFLVTRADAVGRAALDAVLAADPRDEEALAMRAMLNFDESRRDAALADLRALALGHPDATVLAAATAALAGSEPPAAWPLLADLPTPRIALDHFLIGYWARRASRFRDAAAALDEALRLDPGHTPSAHLRLLVLADLEDDGVLDAAGAVEQMLGGPTERTLHLRGFAHARQSRWPEAAADLEACVALGPPSAGSLRNLAIVRRNLGDLDGALRLLEQAGALRPEARGTFLERFNLLLQLERTDEAAALAETLPEDLPIACSTRAFARGRVLLAAANRAANRGQDVEPMRSEAEAALTAAMQGAPPQHARAIALDLANTDFLRDRDHGRALAAVLAILGPKEDFAAALRMAWYHADGIGQKAVARHFLECANAREPAHADTAHQFAALLLADEPPDPRRALAVLAGACRDAAGWARERELALRAVDGCCDLDGFERALSALGAAADNGLFAAGPAPARLVAALRAFLRDSRSLPPSLAALLAR
ncbi:MAG: serine/threonine-protein kinase [Planctomycetota bacterium]